MEPTESEALVLVALLCALLLPLLGLLAYATHRLYCSIAPLWLVPRGDYAGARRCYDVTRRSLPARLFDGTRLVCDYGLALCDHLEGRHDDAIRRLRSLQRARLSATLRFGVDLALSSSLLLMERDLDDVRALLDGARQTVDGPDLALAAAVAAHLSGDHAAAQSHFHAASTMPTTGSTHVSAQAVLHRDATMVKASTTFLRGWYLMLVGQRGLATPLLREAAAAPHGPARAKALTLLDEPAPRSEPEERGPPSSLTPHVRP